MSPETNAVQPQRITAGAYILAGLSFIPLIGVPFGIFAIIWGLSAGRSGGKRAAAIGAAGIAFTFAVYGSLYYFGVVQRGGIYDDLRTKLAQSCLDSAVKSVEFYRQAKGSYPDSMDVLARSMPDQSFDRVCLADPRLDRSPRIGGTEFFNYKKIDDSHYYLRALSPDGKPFAPGALVPSVKGANLGLVIAPPTN
jgi:hypothetical protein